MLVEAVVVMAVVQAKLMGSRTLVVEVAMEAEVVAVSEAITLMAPVVVAEV
jgi:hypothetical protein